MQHKAPLTFITIVAFIIVIPICIVILILPTMIFDISMDQGTQGTATLLIQNHDDGEWYLSETQSFTTATTLSWKTGLDKPRCLYLDSDNSSQSALIQNDILSVEKIGNTVHYITTQSLLTQDQQPCPYPKFFFHEGVKNRTVILES